MHSSTILNLGTRWRSVVSFKAQPFYSKGNSPRYQLCGRLGGPQGQSGRHGKENNLLFLPGIEPQFPGRPAHNLVAIPIEVFRLILYYAQSVLLKSCDSVSEEPVASIFSDAPACYLLHSDFLHGLSSTLGDASLKCRLTFNGLHGVISQKIEPYITDAVRSTNRSLFFLFRSPENV
jgi:hypothetical protein